MNASKFKKYFSGMKTSTTFSLSADIKLSGWFHIGSVRDWPAVLGANGPWRANLGPTRCDGWEHEVTGKL